MLHAKWLQGLQQRLHSPRIVKWGGGRKSRRTSLNWSPLAVEVLEVRLVLDSSDPPESPIDPATASGDATAARAALNLAASSFDVTVSPLEGTFQSELGTHQSDFNDDVEDAIDDFTTDVDSINGALAGDLDTLGSGFDVLVDGHEVTFDGDLDTAEGDFNTNMAGPTNTLQTSLDGTDAAFDSSLTTADNQLDLAINGLGGFQDVLDGVVGPQQTTLTSNIAGHNATFAGVVTSEQSNFDTLEGGYWSNYLAAVGTGPTGLETSYNSTLTGAESTRDGILSTNSSHTYDPSVLYNTTAYTTLIDGANATLNSDLQTAADNYASNIAARETTFDNAINGTGGAVETFNNLMDAADDQFDLDMDNADGNYDSAMLIAQGIYDGIVDGLETTFESNVAVLTDTYNDAVDLALSNREDDRETHQTTFDNAVEAADQAYDDWINGTSTSGPITVVTTRTTYVEPGTWKTRYSIVTVYTDGNGVSTTTNSTTGSSTVPTGTLVSSIPGIFTTDAGITVSATIETYTTTITPPATQGNVFLVAMQTRLEQLEERLEEIGEALADAIAGFQATRNGAIETANDNYDLAAGGSTGFVAVYDGAVSTAHQNASDTMSDAQGDYQDALNLYNQAVMDAMMNGDPMPSNTSVLVATRDYQLAAAGADVLLASDLGTALVAFVSAERGFDTIRDTDIINAISDYLEDSINEADAKQQEAIAEVVDAIHDLIDLDDGFAKADADQQKDRIAAISDAAKQFALDENQSDETLLLAESTAWQSYQKDVATEVQTFRNGEMGARVTLMQSEASAAEQWEMDSTNAITGWMIAAANAQDTFASLSLVAEVNLHFGLLQDYVTNVGDVTTAFSTWGNTISNGVASLYAGNFGGATDATNVANAWRSFDQAAVGAWKSFVDNDALAMEGYGQSAALAAQSAALNISAQNVLRVNDIASDFLNFTTTVAPAVKLFEQSVWGAMIPWMTTAAAAEKTAADGYADNVNAYETSLFAELHDQADDDATAIDDLIDNVLGDWLPYIQNVITAQTDATHDRTDAFDTWLTDVRIAGTTLADDNRVSWQTFKLGVVGQEDGLMSAHAADQKAQAVLGAVNNYTTLSATPLSNFESQIGQPAMVGMGGMMLTRPNSDDDYIAWGSGIAAAVNPPAPAPATVDAGRLMSQIEQAAKPRDSISIPLVNGNLGPSTPADILRQTLDPTGTILPQPFSHLTVDFTRIPLPSPNPYAPAGPQPPTLAESFVPITGNYKAYRYSLHQGNYLEAAWHGANAVSDVTLVKSLVQSAVKGIWKLASKLTKPPPNLTGVLVNAGGGVGEGAQAAANALNNAGDALRGAEAAGAAASNVQQRLIQGAGGAIQAGESRVAVFDSATGTLFYDVGNAGSHLGVVQRHGLPVETGRYVGGFLKLKNDGGLVFQPFSGTFSFNDPDLPSNVLDLIRGLGVVALEGLL